MTANNHTAVTAAILDVIGKSFSKFTRVVTPKETFSEIKRLLTHLLTK